MKPISIRILAAAIGCPCGEDRKIERISTDSRKIAPGCVFVCIEGEQFDGHDFAVRAVENGAAYVVARKRVALPDTKVFYVGDTLAANIALAGAYRRQFSPLSVGITGSVGKTTTKEFAASVLSRKYKTLKTEGNHNNEIGVPATLLGLDESYGAMVVEMGMDAPGNIDTLSRAVLPDIAVITAIGTSHIQKLGSRENILKAKMEVAALLPDGAPLILNGDNDLLSTVKDGRLRVVRYGLDSAGMDYRAENIEEGGAAFDVVCAAGRFPVRIPVFGRHNVYDALAAFAVGMEAGVGSDGIARGLMDFQPAGMRQKVVRTGGVTVVEDCYNASPESMAAAMDTLGQMDGRRIAVLGDMLELGTAAPGAHRAVGARCAGAGVDILLCVGEFAGETVEGAKDAGMGRAEGLDGKAELSARLARLVQKGDVVWFKASRGVRLEEAVQAFTKEIEGKNL